MSTDTHSTHDATAEQAEQHIVSTLDANAVVLDEPIPSPVTSLDDAITEQMEVAHDEYHTNVEHAPGHTSGNLLEDPYFWIVLSTIIFVAIIIQKGSAPLLNALDNRSRRISDELDQAEKLRVEAQELLAEYQRKHRDAVKMAEGIISQAKDQAKIIQKETQTKMDDSLKRREAQLVERISRAELSAVQEVREQAADISSAAAESLVIMALSKTGSKLIDTSIAGLPKKLSVV